MRSLVTRILKCMVTNFPNAHRQGCDDKFRGTELKAEILSNISESVGQFLSFKCVTTWIIKGKFTATFWYVSN